MLETIVFEPNDGEMTKRVRELLAATVITPGHLVQRDGAGAIEVHDTAQGRAAALFAIENLGNAGVIDDDYAIGQTTHFYAAQPGDHINGLVLNGTAAIAEGAALASAGDGTLITVVDTADAKPLDGVVVGYALEAVDNSGGASPVRIKMEAA